MAQAHPLRTASAVQPGMALDIEFADGRVGATAQGVSKRIESPPLARPRPRRRSGEAARRDRATCSADAWLPPRPNRHPPRPQADRPTSSATRAG